MLLDMKKKFVNFKEFWPFYIGEHRHPLNRRLHFIGAWFALAALVLAVVQMNWLWLLAMPLFGYGFAWIGHFVIEKNRPATFSYPVLSLMGDIYMFFQILLRRKLD
jgi:hypothetical protein